VNLPVAPTLLLYILDWKLEQSLSAQALLFMDETKLRDVFQEQSLFSNLYRVCSPQEQSKTSAKWISLNRGAEKVWRSQSHPFHLSDKLLFALIYLLMWTYRIFFSTAIEAETRKTEICSILFVMKYLPRGIIYTDTGLSWVWPEQG